MTWRKARKRPMIVEFREVEPRIHIRTKHSQDGKKEIWGEEVNTGHGFAYAYPDEDFIIRDEAGEYPIKKEIFERTYEVIE